MDFSAALVHGPWEHHFVSAGGTRFHYAETGPASGPLVVLLHGFPQFWWAWRHQLTALGEAGYRTIALDLRGYGASDKPPTGNTIPHLAQDVAAIISCLGSRQAVVAGQGLGGLVAWAMPVFTPAAVAAVAVFDSPHPIPGMTRLRTFCSIRSLAQIAGFHVPGVTQRALRRGDLVNHCLGTWSAYGWKDEESAALYRDLMRVPFAAAKAVEQVRWAFSGPLHPEGRRFLAAFQRPIDIPVLHVQGGFDHLWRPSAMPAPEYGGPAYHFESLKAIGHFVPEEAPDAASHLLVRWLRNWGW